MAYEFVPDPKTNSPSALIETNTFLVTDTTLYVDHVEYFPDATSDEPGIAVLGRGEDCETITYTGKTGTSGSGTLTGITREVDKETIGGVEYGTKKQWEIGDDVACVLTAYHLKKLIANATRNTPVTSTSDPTVNDDSGDGYEVGKVWVNTSSDVTFVCADNSSGAAVWLRVLDTSDKTGADAGIVSGTAGSENQTTYWNADGDAVGKNPTQIIFLSGGGGWASTTSGDDGFTQIELETNDVDVKGVSFPSSASAAYHQYHMRMPNNYNGGTVTAQFDWMTNDATPSGDISWKIDAQSYSDDDPLDAAWGSAVEVVDTIIAQNDKHTSAVSAPITIANSPTGGDWVAFRVYRDGADASDTSSNDVVLMGVNIIYGTNDVGGGD